MFSLRVNVGEFLDENNFKVSKKTIIPNMLTMRNHVIDLMNIFVDLIHFVK